MISKKIIPLMGITVLLMLVNPTQADADLCGDFIELEVLNDETGGSIFLGVGQVAWSDSFEIVPGVSIDFTVFCSDQQDGSTTIFFDYSNDNQVDTLVPDHSFWFNDLEWVDAEGRVVGFIVFSDTIQNNGHTDTSVHAIVPGFLFPGDSGFTNDLVIFASHAVGGEFVPMSSSALLLAGAQNSMSWMIPLVIAAAGFGIVISRKL